jgi:membrane-bound lytic murein transglycosylase B
MDFASQTGRRLSAHRLRLMASTLLLACVGLGAVAQAATQAQPKPAAQRYGNDPRVQAFANDWAQAHGVSASSVMARLAPAKRRQDVIRLMSPPTNVYEKNWNAYRERFVTDERIAKALIFWRRHQSALEAAQSRYGVDAHIIVGILGVETIYGEQRGKVPTLDALTTLAFDFPAAHPRAAERAAYFRGELSALLELSHSLQRPLKAWRGSYAGALGYPQFMPSSWQRWGVDFDGNGQVDLINSPVDAIGSVANYLQSHGWVKDLPARWSTAVDESSPALGALLAPDILPTLDTHALRSAGVVVPPELDPIEQPLALVKLFNGRQGHPSYVIGSANFYAITRYNQSSYYALAVIELAEAVAREMQNKP